MATDVFVLFYINVREIKSILKYFPKWALRHYACDWWVDLKEMFYY
jgi:hypothetical protein